MSKTILGIDPGSEESGYCIIDDKFVIYEAGKVSNADLIDMIVRMIDEGSLDEIAIESIQSYGMTMGKTTIETCYMIGRVIQVCEIWPTSLFLYPRPEYGKAIVGSNKLNDALIRSALENRFGSYDKGKPEKKLKNGTIKQEFKPDGPLFLLAGESDKRSAFAVAVYHIDKGV